MKKGMLAVVFAVMTIGLIAFVSRTSFAQDKDAKTADTKTETNASPAEPGLGGPGGPGFGGPGNRPDPQAMRDRMNQMLKENLGATDDEWKVLQPRIQKVFELQMKARSGGMMAMMRGMRGGRRSGDGAGPQGPGPQGPGPQGPGRQGMGQQSPEAEALRTALDAPDAKPKDIEAKLKAYREAKAKNEAELEQAREELQKTLTVKQEASLVLMGILE